MIMKTYTPSEYTKFGAVALSVVHPLDEFPRPLKNHQHLVNDEHARMISEAINKAEKAIEESYKSEWNTIGKRLLTLKMRIRTRKPLVNKSIFGKAAPG